MSLKRSVGLIKTSVFLILIFLPIFSCTKKAIQNVKLLQSNEDESVEITKFTRTVISEIPIEIDPYFTYHKVRVVVALNSDVSKYSAKIIFTKTKPGIPEDFFRFYTQKFPNVPFPKDEKNSPLNVSNSSSEAGLKVNRRETFAIVSELKVNSIVFYRSLQKIIDAFLSSNSDKLSEHRQPILNFVMDQYSNRRGWSAEFRDKLLKMALQYEKLATYLTVYKKEDQRVVGTIRFIHAPFGSRTKISITGAKEISIGNWGLVLPSVCGHPEQRMGSLAQRGFHGNQEDARIHQRV